MPSSSKSNSNNTANSGFINNNSRRTQTRTPRWGVRKSDRANLPVIGEVRMHRKSGIMYVYELYRVRRRGPERAGWLRLDTWVRRALPSFPFPVARERNLVKFNRAQLGLEDAPATFVQITFS